MTSCLISDDGTQAQNVFYNPIQQFNRDLSVLAIRAFGEDLCQKKRVRLEKQGEKVWRKRERKRKRNEVKQESEEKEEGGVESGRAEDGTLASVAPGSFGPESKRDREESKQDGEDEDGRSAKLRKAEDGSPSAAEQGVVAYQQAEQSSAGTQEHHMGLRDTADGGVNVAQSAESIDATESAAAATSKNVEQPVNGANDATRARIGDTDIHRPRQPRFRILDALSATGLRALRYASEIPFATAVVANDRDKNAVTSIDLNVEHNKLSSTITTTTGDALVHMYSVAFPPAHSHGPHHISGKYDVIDLDPYGTAAPFIDAALQALEDGGLLCVTCTDSGVFASCGYSEKTYSLYGGMPIKGSHSHEGGLRLILHSVATAAAKYGIAIEPLLSLSIDFYARLFIRVRKSAMDVKFLAGKTMLVYGCDAGCGAWTTQFIGRHQLHKNSTTTWKFTIAQAPSADVKCEHCGSKTHIAGPMWGGPLHNAAFVEKILNDVAEADQGVYETKPRMEGVLDTALDELSVKPNLGAFVMSGDRETDIIPKTPSEVIDYHPFFFIPSLLCKVIKAQAPAEDLLRGALRHAGYRATRSHCKAGSIKTDAPWSVLWEIMREWVRQKAPIKDGALREGQAGFKIMQAMRKPEDAVANGDDRGVAAVEQVNRDGTPDIVTEAIGSASVSQDGPTDPKRMEVVFDERLGRDKPGKRRLVRYQQNPRENWGPMTKAKGRG